MSLPIIDKVEAKIPQLSRHYHSTKQLTVADQAVAVTLYELISALQMRVQGLESKLKRMEAGDDQE